jgi:hypothetical protein
MSNMSNNNPANDNGNGDKKPAPPPLSAAIPRRPPTNQPIPRKPSISAQPPSAPAFRPGQSLPAIPRRPSSQPIPRRAESNNQPLSRKSSVPPQPAAPRSQPKLLQKATRGLPLQARQRTERVKILSERPFLVKIKTRGVPSDEGIPLQGRVSERAPKRKRPTYQDLEDTDSEDFMDTDEEDVVEKKKLKKKTKSPSVTDEVATELAAPTAADNNNVAQVNTQVDAPPPGVLPNLWYSREQVLHLWVIEKIIGWKKRPVVSYVWTDTNALKCLDQVEAQAITVKAVASEALWKDPAKRMEVSRVNSMQCPIVMHLAAKKEELAAEKEGRPPRYKLAGAATPPMEEEVLLVKWRGRSYIHTSWERKKDLEKFDQSNNTARGKIRRYIQAQEITYGQDWKQLLLSDGTAAPTEEGEPGTEDELFPPQYMEVERLLACDESDMNTSMFAKQRALNIREEQRMLKQREQEDVEGDYHLHKTGIFDDLPVVSDGEDPWDPEDYVRYVVKWKGQQYSEMTWEYWINIKRDAVNQAEDFWFRQQAPDPADILKLPPHPHMRDFRKLTASPAFGFSNRPRPVADLGDGPVLEEDDEKEAREFKLRSYQLEGVNWLLFNWWNKRSCIL